jgi:outer membrane protein OmpA-like peptidoglycan-associated protein
MTRERRSGRPSGTGRAAGHEVFLENAMKVRALVVGMGVLAWAGPAAAQQRGTMEFGGFGSAASFDQDLSLKSGFGGGGRVGMYLHPRWSLEFEAAEMRASRPNGLRNVNVGLLTSRLVAAPVRAGPLSLLVGAGAGAGTETNFLHSYGVDALVGAKLAVHPNVALRLDGVSHWLANEQWKSFRSVRLGLSLYRFAGRRTQLAAAASARADSVSADETRRLRGRDAALQTLRDSLRMAPAYVRTAPVTTAALATMQAEIRFAFDKSALSDSAKAVLDDKVAVFRANPDMTIVMVGYTDVTGSDAYNMALGTRRAEVARAYIVARGIEAGRVLIESKGERQQIANSAGADGEAPNRRAIFRLLMTPDVIATP